MAKLTIKDFQTGIAQSPYFGFSEMRNADIFTLPGAFKISQKLVASGNSDSVVLGFMKWCAQDPLTGDVYTTDNIGTVYKYDIGTDTWSVIAGHGVGNGEGLGIWKDYLFYARPGNLEVYGPLSGSPAWTTNWQTLTTPQYNAWHPILSATDDILYIGDAQYVTTLEEVTGQTFDPSNGATYTWNSQDLELGSLYQVTTLEELGSDIAIGTSVGVNNNINIANTFFWDGFSDSFSLNKTIHFAENGVWQMKNLGNTIYTVAGTGRTRLFSSQTSQGIETKRLNNLTLGNVLNPFVDAIDQKDGELLFGVSSVLGPNGSSPMGVYSYRNGSYTLRNIISTGNDGSTGGIFIGSVFLYTPELYFVSYYDEDANTYGVDTLSPLFYTGYKARVDSALYQVANDDDPITYEKCEICMGKALVAGDKVRISARYDLSGSFTTICEFDTTVQTGFIGKSVIDQKVSSLGSFKNIQIRIELDTDSISTSSPELITVTLQ